PAGRVAFHEDVLACPMSLFDDEPRECVDLARGDPGEDGVPAQEWCGVLRRHQRQDSTRPSPCPLPPPDEEDTDGIRIGSYVRIDVDSSADRVPARGIRRTPGTGRRRTRPARPSGRKITNVMMTSPTTMRL